jgi:ubiquinone/menaquinone biosynthesis C-methylase UbiE
MSGRPAEEPPTMEHAGTEVERIRQVYEARARTVPADRYSFGNPSALFTHQQRVREVTRLLTRKGFFPLDEVRILDVGCGRGGWLVDFESWGAAQRNLAGIDIVPASVAHTQDRVPGADIRQGDGVTLPWPDASFDLVAQSTVFTSILDIEVKRQLAREMARVLAPGGGVLWWDFHRDNPRNRDVRGVARTEIQELFPGFDVSLRRITLAPPISRRLVRISWTGALVLETLRLFNTHYLGLLQERVR